MSGLRIVSLKDAPQSGRAGILEEELITPVQAIRWIALGALLPADAAPRSWLACSPERILAEKKDLETRMLFAELAVLDQIKSGQMRCVLVQASTDSGTGERLMLSILDTAELEDADVQREWRQDGLTLLISQNADLSPKELSGFLFFWSEVDAFRVEYTQGIPPDPDLEKTEEIRIRRALISVRQSVEDRSASDTGGKRPGKTPERLYARAVLKFAEILKAQGVRAAKAEKLEVLSLRLVEEFVKDRQGKLNERHARDEARAIREFVFDDGAQP